MSETFEVKLTLPKTYVLHPTRGQKMKDGSTETHKLGDIVCDIEKMSASNEVITALITQGILIRAQRIDSGAKLGHKVNEYHDEIWTPGMVFEDIVNMIEKLEKGEVPSGGGKSHKTPLENAFYQVLSLVPQFKFSTLKAGEKKELIEKLKVDKPDFYKSAMKQAEANVEFASQM